MVSDQRLGLIPYFITFMGQVFTAWAESFYCLASISAGPQVGWAPGNAPEVNYDAKCTTWLKRCNETVEPSPLTHLAGWSSP